MNNFEFISPTKIIFGKDEENRIGEILKKRRVSKNFTSLWAKIYF